MAPHPGRPAGAAAADRAGPSLPRSRHGPQSQHLLATLLGLYGLGLEEAVPGATLRRLLAEFGVSDVAARSALARVARRGLIEPVRSGRTTAYRMSADAREIQQRRTDQFLDADGGAPWDGFWTVLVFSLPEEDRGVRQALRTGMHRLGLRLFRDGVWVTPHDVSAEATARLRELGVRAAVVWRGTVVGLGDDSADPVRAFELDAVADGYRRFLDDLRRRAAGAGAASPEAALVTRTELFDAGRRLVDTDPHLPADLLPSDWPAGPVRAAFLDVFEALRPAAEARLAALLGAAV